MTIGVFNTFVVAIISSLVGGSVGGLVAWGGIRIRLDHLENKVKSLGDAVVYKDVCEKCQHGNEKSTSGIERAIEEIRNDIKCILGKVG
jgi:hypothetical protein